MKTYRRINSITQKAEYIRNKKIPYNLIRVLTGDSKSTSEEKAALKQLKEALHDEFYVELIFTLTNKLIRDKAKAKTLYRKIIRHKNKLSKLADRNVGVEVATLDYFKNIYPLIKNPEIIECDELNTIASLAITDECTGLFDRKVFITRLEKEIARAKRYGNNVSLIFCDIDNFKRINDTYGHVLGDTVLLKVAQKLKRNVRISDTVFRYGGEEFVCLLPETELIKAEDIAERLRKEIAKMEVPIDKKRIKKIKITMSFGVAQYGVGGINDPSSLITIADYMMYQAKQSGKNCIRIFSNGETETIESKKKSTAREAMLEKNVRSFIKGEVISPGYALGKAFRYTDILSAEVALYSVKKKDVGRERSRINRALGHVYDDVKSMMNRLESEDDVENANIFRFHQQVLMDSHLADELNSELDNELINAEHVVKNVFRKLSDRFKLSDNSIIRSKSDDIDDLCRKLMRVLVGHDLSILEHIPPHSIVIARRLLPSDTVHLKRKNLKGIIVQEGSPHSHGALLARAFGIPAIANPENSLDIINNGNEVIIDGQKGEIIVSPSRGDIKRVSEQIRMSEEQEKQMEISSKKITRTKDGKRIHFYVTAYATEDAILGERYGASGIGLFRMEQIYLQTSDLPTVDELVINMDTVLRPMQDKEITVRLLDAGGDKALPYVQMPDEENPFLGLRGIRFLLKNKDILRTQIKAILRLSKKYSLKVLVPMVSIADEMKQVRDMVEDVASSHKEFSSEPIRLGAMIEVPGAVFNIAEIVKYCDFLSVGSNDLIQYTMAAGRENSSVEEYFKYGVKPVMYLIERIVAVGKKNNIETYVCGELAGDKRYIHDLIKVGVDRLSVSVNTIPELRLYVQALGNE